MMRATAIAIFALLFLSSCSKTATTAPSAATGATAAPASTATSASIARTATAPPQQRSTKTNPSPTGATLPTSARTAAKFLLPTVKPSPKKTSQNISTARATPAAKSTVANLPVKSAAPKITATPAPTAAPAVVAVVGNIANGRDLYEQHCANCHGADAQGGMGPSLQNEDARKNLRQTISWIEHPALPMPNLYPGTLSKKDVLDIATYVQSLE